MFELIVYGGAFNPPHAGHVDVICQLSSYAKRILVVPSYRHAHGKDMAPFDLRERWLHQIANQLSRRGIMIDVDICEKELGQGHDRPVYSWDVLNHIAKRESLSKDQIGFVIGEDNVNALSTFYRANELVQYFGLVVAKEQIAIHSTDIRKALSLGKTLEPSWLALGMTGYDYEYFAQSR